MAKKHARKTQSATKYYFGHNSSGCGVDLALGESGKWYYRYRGYRTGAWRLHTDEVVEVASVTNAYSGEQVPVPAGTLVMWGFTNLRAMPDPSWIRLPCAT